MDTRRQLAEASLLVATVAILLSACGGSTAKVDPETLLQQAKATADATSGVRFVVTSTDVHVSENLTGGTGDLMRPDLMEGNFTVIVDGFNVGVKAVSSGGVFEALIPFASHYARINPASYGLTDPAQLLNSNHGLTSLLTEAIDPQLSKQERVDGELLDTVTFTVPGSKIPVLPDANPSQPVQLVAAINPHSHQLRQVTLTGPLTSDAYNSTYTVTLTDYNEHVTITLPPT